MLNLFRVPFPPPGLAPPGLGEGAAPQTCPNPCAPSPLTCSTTEASAQASQAAWLRPFAFCHPQGSLRAFPLAIFTSPSPEHRWGPRLTPCIPSDWQPPPWPEGGRAALGVGVESTGVPGGKESLPPASAPSALLPQPTGDLLGGLGASEGFIRVNLLLAGPAQVVLQSPRTVGPASLHPSLLSSAAHTAAPPQHTRICLRVYLFASSADGGRGLPARSEGRGEAAQPGRSGLQVPGGCLRAHKGPAHHARQLGDGSGGFAGWGREEEGRDAGDPLPFPSPPPP